VKYSRQLFTKAAKELNLQPAGAFGSIFVTSEKPVTVISEIHRERTMASQSPCGSINRSQNQKFRRIVGPALVAVIGLAGFASAAHAQAVNYTLLGDANLDGKVNGTDFAILASNFNQSVTGWDNGDFAYDSGIPDGQTDNVPEPASATLLLTGAAALLARRRRSASR
jgi:hypothetical protein